MSGLSQVFFSIGLIHSIQGGWRSREVWSRRAGQPAVGTSAEEAGRFIRLVLEKAGLPPLKVLLKLLEERR